jgi:hypothetical protein
MKGLTDIEVIISAVVVVIVVVVVVVVVVVAAAVNFIFVCRQCEFQSYCYRLFQ